MNRYTTVLLTGLSLWLLGPVRPLRAQSTAPPFENEIRAFETQDQTSPPRRKGIVFTGSSSIRLWPELQGYFPGKPVVQRGFGGSQLSDLIRYADRIVVVYRPKQVVIYSGENDIAAKVPAREVYERFVTLFRHLRGKLPRTSVVFIAIKPSPSRRAFRAEVEAANRLIKDFLATQKRTAFVDVFTPMLGPNGQPMPHLFKADSLHMTEAGYQIWARQLAPALR